MEDKQEHPYLTSLRHFLTVYGLLSVAITLLFVTGKIQGAWSWQGSQEISTNMDYAGPTYKGHK